MKDNKHIQSFGQFNENLNISDVRSSEKRYKLIKAYNVVLVITVANISSY
jgi:hypothetical protein